MLVLLLIFLFVYLLLIGFYYKNWRSLPTFEPSAEAPHVFVSVIIAARNEAATLPALLQQLLQQHYPAQLFEIIVVDDFSTDNTAALVKAINDPRIQLLSPPADEKSSSKKLALQTGIAAAKGPVVVITDADCSVTKDWISLHAAIHRQHNAAFIAAPVCFTTNGSLLQTLQALDFITLQGITAASVFAGTQAMCNGANLSYTKNAFTKVDGFTGIDAVASGDDVLLMHKIKIAFPQQVFYLKNKAAIVHTEPMRTWKNFLAQRRRWASKTLLYQDKWMIAILFFVLLLNLIFPTLLVLGIFHAHYLLFAFGFLLAKALIEFLFVYSVAKFYGAQKLMLYFIPLQPVHALYTVVAGLLSQFGTYEWKGRRTK